VETGCRGGQTSPRAVGADWQAVVQNKISWVVTTSSLVCGHDVSEQHAASVFKESLRLYSLLHNSIF
jgi:hypothetical protein